MNEEMMSKNTMPKLLFQLEEGIKRQLQQLITEFLESYQYTSRFRMDEPESNPYVFYMQTEKLNWSDNMINDVANWLLLRQISLFSDVDIQEEMANNLSVLLDDAKSKRWLCRIAKAERSSVAYERALRLIGNGNNVYHNVIACDIMQQAADAGDELCAMRLVESALSQLIHKHKYHGHMPSLKCAYGVVYAESGDVFRSNDILQNAASEGDVDSALYLIEQKVVKQIKEKKMKLGDDFGKLVGYNGVGITWDEDQIRSFLLKRYDAGDDKAKELLKLLLILDVNDRLEKAPGMKSCINSSDKAKRTELVKKMMDYPGTTDYPATVIQEVLNSSYCNVRKVSCTSAIRRDDDSDEMPM